LVGVVEALYADPIRTIYAVADKVNEGGESAPASTYDTPAEAPAAEAAEAPVEATDAPTETPETPEGN
jgi:large subunit ribosomal protein L10